LNYSPNFSARSASECRGAMLRVLQRRSPLGHLDPLSKYPTSARGLANGGRRRPARLACAAAIPAMLAKLSRDPLRRERRRFSACPARRIRRSPWRCRECCRRLKTETRRAAHRDP